MSEFNYEANCTYRATDGEGRAIVGSDALEVKAAAMAERFKKFRLLMLDPYGTELFTLEDIK